MSIELMASAVVIHGMLLGLARAHLLELDLPNSYRAPGSMVFALNL